MPTKETYEVEDRRFKDLGRAMSRAVELSFERGETVTVNVHEGARTCAVVVQFQDEPTREQHMADQASVSELKLFTENDGDIYRQQTVPILRNLRTKQAQGRYDHDRAVDLFMYLAEAGARKYAREHGGGEHEWHLIFPIDVRRQASAEWRDEFETESSLGNYDNATFLPKKYLEVKKPTTKRPRRPNTTAKCDSGVATGEHCQWSGKASELTAVIWMPEHLRSSHIAAHNSGVYPANGARKLMCCPDCAEMLGDDMKAFESEVNAE
jgi:hypothetical protein